jgi:hypothetical protein
MDAKHEEELRQDQPTAEAESVTSDQKKPENVSVRVKTGIKAGPTIIVY